MARFRQLTIVLACWLVAGLSVRAEDDKWTFRVSPYVWGPSVSGDASIGDVSTDLDLPIDETLRDHLDLAGMLNLEARKGRWGLLVDGVYLSISPESETPGPFFNTIETTIDLAIIDMALGYRLIEGERGWLDLLVGARYVDLSVELDMNPDYAAVDQISGVVMDKAVTAVRNGLADSVESTSGEIAVELAGLTEDVGEAARAKILEKVQGPIDERVDQIISRVDEIEDRIDSIPPRQLDKIKEKIQDALDNITDAQREAIAEAVKERINAKIGAIQGDAAALGEEIRDAAAAKINELKKTVSGNVKQALEEAEAELAAAIEEGMKLAANSDIQEAREWVDPYVGVRGRLNITDRAYVGARADVGGFGVGSELTWQLFAGVGMKLTPNVDIEAGWRHLDIDYEDEPFELDLELSGAVIGMRFGF